MKILITGSNGFIGQNLIASLKNNDFNDLLCYDINSSDNDLNEYLLTCDFIFHLAGVNRPEGNNFYVNVDLTNKIISIIKKHNRKIPILFTSSIQAILNNDYGRSKELCEDILLNYSAEIQTPVYIYRLQNVFGKWCKPGYNSVIATFCYNKLNGLPIIVNDRNVVLNLIYIDDVISAFINTMKSYTFCEILPVFNIKLGLIEDIITSFSENIYSLEIPDLSNDFVKKLYSTFISYLPDNHFKNNLKSNIDDRGSFSELLKSKYFGQLSVNTAKPNITKGNHYHHSKLEKFIVLSGEAVIRLRKYNSDKIMEYYVSGNDITEVYIPCGYVHSIKNIGDKDLIFIIWANEIFDKNNQDTYFQEV